MRFHTISLLVATAVGAAPLPAAHAGAPVQRPVAFRAEAKVTLDAAGQPLAIEPSEDLPPSIRDFIRQRVATWHFSPPEQDGVTGGAVTYLRLGACAIPQPDGNYRMAVDFKGNGPLYAGGPTMRPPGYPRDAMIRHIEALALVTFVVGTDGRASVEDIAYKDARDHRHDGIDKSLRDWVAAMRFEPEHLAGHAVRTRLRVPVKFTIDGRGYDRDEFAGSLREKSAKSEECRLASGEAQPEGLRPVVLNSPVRLEPKG